MNLSSVQFDEASLKAKIRQCAMPCTVNTQMGQWGNRMGREGHSYIAQSIRTNTGSRPLHMDLMQS